MRCTIGHTTMRNLLLVLLVAITASCSKNTPEPGTPSGMYFPPASGVWETTSPEALGWNTSAISALEDFLSNTNTRAFILLQNGRIVMEKYYGTTATGAPFTASSNWYWASAGKTATALLTGIARDEGHLALTDKTSRYLGNGWTSLSAAQEDRIQIIHQLTMTTGLNDATAEQDCTNPPCLQYKADAGTRWAYHNAPYTLLDKVIANATGQSFQAYFNKSLADKIGMQGLWVKVDYNNVLYSTPRSMARFGLLMLNRGDWDGKTVLAGKDYFNQMTNTSQNLNLSYGYLTWLNGKASSMYPGLQAVFPIPIAGKAPADMYAAMGKNGQLINVVPSKNLVFIRMGDNPDVSLVPVTYQNDIWERLNAIIR